MKTVPVVQVPLYTIVILLYTAVKEQCSTFRAFFKPIKLQIISSNILYFWKKLSLEINLEINIKYLILKTKVIITLQQFTNKICLSRNVITDSDTIEIVITHVG